MRERPSDTVLAIVLALLIHAVPLVVLVLAALWPSAKPSAAPGEPVVAAVVDRGALPASMRRALARDPEPMPEALEEPPEPLPDALPEEETPPPQQLEAQELIVDPDETAQEEVRADSDSPETAPREQEAQQTQGQRDLTERERQREEEQRIRQTELQKQREQQLADIRRQIEAERKKAEESERKMRELAERRAREASQAAAAEDAAASPPPGNRGDDVSAAYFAAIADAIRRNWVRPNEIRGSQVCKIRIRQSPGGRVLEAQVEPSCPYDEPGRRSVEAAVLKAQPLPYAGFESAFKREFVLNFRAEDF